ncbi:hypothetical protein [Paralcaligenes ginsengisoli]
MFMQAYSRILFQKRVGLMSLHAVWRSFIPKFFEVKFMLSLAPGMGLQVVMLYPSIMISGEREMQDGGCFRPKAEVRLLQANDLFEAANAVWIS